MKLNVFIFVLLVICVMISGCSAFTDRTIKTTPDVNSPVTVYPKINISKTTPTINSQLSDIQLENNRTPIVQWEKTHGGSNCDRGSYIQQTNDGGYIITGLNVTPDGFDTDAFLLKIDASGNPQWYKRYGGPWGQEGECVIQTADGGYALAGRTHSANTESAYVVKTDALGDQLWAKDYPSGNSSAALSIQEVKGGYIIAGFRDKSIRVERKNVTNPEFKYTWLPHSDIYLIRTDKNGNIVWDKTYINDPQGYQSEGYSIYEAKDGGYIASGYVYANSSSGLYLFKLDAGGNQVWNGTYPSGNVVHDNMDLTSDGGYIIGGSFGRDAYLVKTDSTGNVQWNRTYNVGGMRIAYSVKQTDEGGYIIGGMTFNTTEDKGIILKTDAQGNVKWYKAFGGTGLAYACSAWQTADGGYIACGVIHTDDKSDQVYVIKFAPEA